VNRLYPNAKELFATKQLSWTNDAIVCILVDTGVYTYSDAHQTLADIPSTGTVAVSGTMTGRVAPLGVCDADDVSYPIVPIGPNVEACVLAVNSGTVATSFLVAYLDQAAGLPFSPDGGPAVIAWDNGTNRLFAL